MNRFKLIALDMDGTLLDEQLKISPANRKAIAQAQQKGIHVVLSTGRFIGSTCEYARSLGLTSYLVTSNGVEIWNPSGELMERHPLPSELVVWMHELARSNGAYYWASTSDGVWHRENFPDHISEYEWLKFGFDTADDHIRETIWHALQATGKLEVSNSSPTNIEVNVKGVNKATGLETVCRKLNITMDDILAIGDSLNDLAMIRAAGCGIAMGNAQKRVKDEADWVTGTNAEDGVAQAIQHWVLGKV